MSTPQRGGVRRTPKSWTLRPGTWRRARPPGRSQESGIERAADGVIDLGVRVATPFVRFGWRTVRGVGKRLGVNPAVERQVGKALDSDTAARTTERVLETPAANQVWDKVLESEQAQKLVERVAEAPGGPLGDHLAGAGAARGRAPDRAPGGAPARRRVRTTRPQGAAPGSAAGERPIYAGGGTRLLAIGFDAAVLSGILLLLTAVVSAVLNAVFSFDGDNTAVTIAAGAFAWWVAATLYLGLFWVLAERTPGMTFFALRISTERGARVGPRQDIRRLVGFALALIPFGLGFLGILTSERRRGWHDRFADTVVLYADPELDSDLPGWTPPPERR